MISPSPGASSALLESTFCNIMLRKLVPLSSIFRPDFAKAGGEGFVYFLPAVAAQAEAAMPFKRGKYS